MKNMTNHGFLNSRSNKLVAQPTSQIGSKLHNIVHLMLNFHPFTLPWTLGPSTLCKVCIHRVNRLDPTCDTMIKTNYLIFFGGLLLTEYKCSLSTHHPSIHPSITYGLLVAIGSLWPYLGTLEQPSHVAQVCKYPLGKSKVP